MFLLKKFYTIKIYMLCILHSRSLKYKSLLCYATLTHQIRFSCSRFKRLELFTQAFKISYGKQVTCRRLDILTYIKKAKQVLQLEKYIHTFEDLLLKQQIYDNFRMQNSKCKQIVGFFLNSTIQNSISYKNRHPCILFLWQTLGYVFLFVWG